MDETELAAIDANGLFTLSDFLPKRPGQDELNAISEMFQASVDGELYDPERWAMFYKPYGVEAPKSATQPTTASVQTAAPVAAPVAEATADIPFDVTPTAAPVVAPAPAPVAPVVPAAEGDAKPSATDILNMIKNRS